MPAVDVRRADDRRTTTGPGRSTAHSFSFGHHYDPDNVAFGCLVALNDERVEPGSGYAEHRHRDVEIVTWVVEGELTHRDSTGAATTVRPGRVQVQAAGDGVVHSESVAADGPPTRFVQCWLRPRQGGGEAAYVVGAVSPGPDWTVLANGRRGPIGVARLDAPATGYAARVTGSLDLPDADLLHLFVTRGTVRLRAGDEAVDLADGDAVRLTASGGTLDGTGEVLVWALDR